MRRRRPRCSGFPLRSTTSACMVAPQASRSATAGAMAGPPSIHATGRSSGSVVAASARTWTTMVGGRAGCWPATSVNSASARRAAIGWRGSAEPSATGAAFFGSAERSSSASSASMAATNCAPSSAGNRRLTNNDPSASRSHCMLRSTAGRAFFVDRAAATTVSTCEAVPCRAMLSRPRSVSGFAIRVIARTFAYEMRPPANASVMAGSPDKACATRRCSRAVRRLSPTRQFNQCEHERTPVPDQPARVSNSAKSWRNRQVAAAR